MSEQASSRIHSLDVLRGVAVMGILVANLPGFALPRAAYWSPLAGEHMGVADQIAWAFTFVAVEGKMRGLFSFLFGASMLLVVQRARAAGESGFAVHYPRMAWLFAIGLVHLYGLWWGDILTHYALVGVAAFLFVDLSVGWLVAIGAALIAVQTFWNGLPALAVFSGTPEAAQMLASFGAEDRAKAAAEIAAMRGSFADTLAWRAAHNISPFDFVLLIWPETLGYLLWGMAGLKSGLLTGGWDRESYRRIAVATLTIGWVAYGALAILTLRSGFDPRYVLLSSIAVSTPLRPILFVGYACVIILLAQPGGRLTERIAAAGRAAFTNYLGTTVVMTGVFQGWGLGLFDRLGRAELLLLIPPAWLLMLAWSKPWLSRYRFGPLEWLWRSLARLEWQRLRLTPRART